jgi:hypothetical protein
MFSSAVLLAASVGLTVVPVPFAGHQPLDGEIQVVARAADGRSESVSATTRLDSEVLLALPGTGRWQVSCAAQAFWCPTIEVDLISPRTRRNLDVFKASAVKGGLSVPRGRRAPDSLLFQGRFKVASRYHEITTTVPVRRGRFSFVLPQLVGDLRASAQGWAPVYWWRLEVRPDKADLGQINLIAGSSVTGVLTTGDDVSAGRDLTTLAARLEPQAELTPAERERVQALGFAAKIEPSGFFQVTEVPPGRYRLEVRSNDEAQAVVEDIEVPGDAEVHIGEVVLRRPITLSIEARPALDGDGGRWRLLVRPLRPVGRLQDKPLRVELDDTGRSALRLQAGDQELSLEDSRGSRLLVLTRSFQADGDLVLDVPLVAIGGRIRLSGRPLAATLALFDEEGGRVELASDPDGLFEGWIRRPSRGRLLVGIRAESPTVERRVTLDALRESDGKLQVDIELEGFTLQGRVKDERGRPLSARVDAEAPGQASFTLTDDQGRFSLSGLAGGRYQVMARRGDRPQMKPVEVDLADGTPTATVELVLPRGRPVAGRVVTATGQAVAGARVLFDGFGTAPMDRPVYSDLDGAFRLEVTRETTAGLITVFPRSLPAHGRCTTLSADDELLVQLDGAPPITLEVAVSTSRALSGAGGVSEWVVYWSGSAVFSLQALISIEAQRSGTLPRTESSATVERYVATLPGLPAGQYALARAQVPWSALVSQFCSVGPPADLEWVSVPGGGTGSLSGGPP